MVTAILLNDVFSRVDMLLLLLLILFITIDALMTRAITVVADPLRTVADQTPRLQTLCHRRRGLMMTMMMTTMSRRRFHGVRVVLEAARCRTIIADDVGRVGAPDHVRGAGRR